jgi:hypothetical protein
VVLFYETQLDQFVQEACVKGDSQAREEKVHVDVLVLFVLYDCEDFAHFLF